MADFKNLLDANPDLRDIELSNYGETFLNPQLLDILQYAHEKGVVLHANNGTNLNHATDEVLEGLAKYKFRSLTCSIDGASQETYSIYRVRGNFDNVINNIRRINYYKEKYRTGFPELNWQYVIFGHNMHEMDIAKKMATELGMGFYFKLSWDDDVSPIKESDLVQLRSRFGYATRDEYKEDTGDDFGRSICRQLWSQPVVNWDGKNLGCCRNFWGEFGGNAFKDGLEKTVNSDGMKHARLMLQGRADPRADIPCTTCDVYYAMEASGHWFRNDEIEKAVQHDGVDLSVVVDASIPGVSQVKIALLKGDVRHTLGEALLSQTPELSDLAIGKRFSVWFTGLKPAMYTVCAIPYVGPGNEWRKLLQSGGLQRLNALWPGRSIKAQTLVLDPKPMSQEAAVAL